MNLTKDTENPPPGIAHEASAGVCSWYGAFAGGGVLRADLARSPLGYNPQAHGKPQWDLLTNPLPCWATVGLAPSYPSLAYAFAPLYVRLA